MNLRVGPSLNIWVVKNLLQDLEISNVHLQGSQSHEKYFNSHQFKVECPDAKQPRSVVTLVQIPKSIHWIFDSISDSVWGKIQHGSHY